MPRVGRLFLGLWLALFGAGITCADEQAGQSPKRFPVTVRVDFGSAEKATMEKEVMVDPGSTPKDVVSLVFPIQSGAICCNTRELAAIDGVWADPAQNRWWSCRVNNSTNLNPFQLELKPQDRVEWIYREEQQ